MAIRKGLLITGELTTADMLDADAMALSDIFAPIPDSGLVYAGSGGLLPEAPVSAPPEAPGGSLPNETGGQTSDGFVNVLSLNSDVFPASTLPEYLSNGDTNPPAGNFSNSPPPGGAGPSADPASLPVERILDALSNLIPGFEGVYSQSRLLDNIVPSGGSPNSSPSGGAALPPGVENLPDRGSEGVYAGDPDQPLTSFFAYDPLLPLPITLPNGMDTAPIAARPALAVYAAGGIGFNEIPIPQAQADAALHVFLASSWNLS